MVLKIKDSPSVPIIRLDGDRSVKLVGIDKDMQGAVDVTFYVDYEKIITNGCWKVRVSLLSQLEDENPPEVFNNAEDVMDWYNGKRDSWLGSNPKPHDEDYHDSFLTQGFNANVHVLDTQVVDLRGALPTSWLAPTGFHFDTYTGGNPENYVPGGNGIPWSWSTTTLEDDTEIGQTPGTWWNMGSTNIGGDLINSEEKWFNAFMNAKEDPPASSGYQQSGKFWWKSDGGSYAPHMMTIKSKTDQEMWDSVLKPRIIGSLGNRPILTTKSPDELPGLEGKLDWFKKKTDVPGSGGLNRNAYTTYRRSDNIQQVMRQGEFHGQGWKFGGDYQAAAVQCVLNYGVDPGLVGHGPNMLVSAEDGLKSLIRTTPMGSRYFSTLKSSPANLIGLNPLVGVQSNESWTPQLGSLGASYGHRKGRHYNKTIINSQFRSLVGTPPGRLIWEGFTDTTTPSAGFKNVYVAPGYNGYKGFTQTLTWSPVKSSEGKHGSMHMWVLVQAVRPVPSVKDLSNPFGMGMNTSWHSNLFPGGGNSWTAAKETEHVVDIDIVEFNIGATNAIRENYHRPIHPAYITAKWHPPGIRGLAGAGINKITIRQIDPVANRVDIYRKIIKCYGDMRFFGWTKIGTVMISSRDGSHTYSDVWSPGEDIGNIHTCVYRAVAVYEDAGDRWTCDKFSSAVVRPVDNNPAQIAAPAMPQIKAGRAFNRRIFNPVVKARRCEQTNFNWTPPGAKYDVDIESHLKHAESSWADYYSTAGGSAVKMPYGWVIVDVNNLPMPSHNNSSSLGLRSIYVEALDLSIRNYRERKSIRRIIPHLKTKLTNKETEDPKQNEQVPGTNDTTANYAEMVEFDFETNDVSANATPPTYTFIDRNAEFGHTYEYTVIGVMSNGSEVRSSMTSTFHNNRPNPMCILRGMSLGDPIFVADPDLEPFNVPSKLLVRIDVKKIDWIHKTDAKVKLKALARDLNLTNMPKERLIKDVALTTNLGPGTSTAASLEVLKSLTGMRVTRVDLISGEQVVWDVRSVASHFRDSYSTRPIADRLNSPRIDRSYRYIFDIMSTTGAELIDNGDEPAKWVIVTMGDPLLAPEESLDALGYDKGDTYKMNAQKFMNSAALLDSTIPRQWESDKYQWLAGSDAEFSTSSTPYAGLKYKRETFAFGETQFSFISKWTAPSPAPEVLILGSEFGTGQDSMTRENKIVFQCSGMTSEDVMQRVDHFLITAHVPCQRSYQGEAPHLTVQGSSTYFPPGSLGGPAGSPDTNPSLGGVKFPIGTVQPTQNGSPYQFIDRDLSRAVGMIKYTVHAVTSDYRIAGSDTVSLTRTSDCPPTLFSDIVSNVKMNYGKG